MGNEQDQDALAEEWAAALEGDDDSGSGDSGGANSDEALAEEWAAALVADEEQSMQSDASNLSAQSTEAQFKDLTEQAKAPRPDGTKRDLDFILIFRWMFRLNSAAPSCSSTNCCNLARARSSSSTSSLANRLKSTSTASSWRAVKPSSSTKNSVCA